MKRKVNQSFQNNIKVFQHHELQQTQTGTDCTLTTCADTWTAQVSLNLLPLLLKTGDKTRSRTGARRISDWAVKMMKMLKMAILLQVVWLQVVNQTPSFQTIIAKQS